MNDKKATELYFTGEHHSFMACQSLTNKEKLFMEKTFRTEIDTGRRQQSGPGVEGR